MRRVWRCLLAVLIGMAALLVGLPASAGAIPTTGACVHVYTYDARGAYALSDEPAAGRGPPASYGDVTTYDADGRRSSGSSARPNASTIPATYDYDHVARLVQTARGSHCVREQVGSADGRSVVVRRSDVAANAAVDASTVLMRTPLQLQKKFKHAGDFGVTGNYSKTNAAKFSAAMHQHMNDAGTQRIVGTYRNAPAAH